MAKLFGYPINIEAEEEEDGGGSSINGEACRSATQPYGEATTSSTGLQSNPYSRFLESGSSPMDSESDLDSCFIDFFGREPYEVDDTVGEFSTGRNQIRDEGSGDMEEDESMDLGLGIGAGSGSGGDSVTGSKETDSGRVEVGVDLTPLEDDLFVVEEGCVSLDPLEDDEEAMLVADDEVLEWENLQNGISWEEEEEEEEEVEEEGEELALPSNANPILENLESQVFSPVEEFYEESSLDADEILREAFEGSSLMYLEYEDLFPELDGDFYDVFAQSFDNQEPPSPIIGTRPASKRVVDELPVVEITSEVLSKGSIVCAICIGDVLVEEKVTRLPCKHYYHGECIVTWLGMKNTCPVCRYELPTDDLESERSRRSHRQGT